MQHSPSHGIKAVAQDWYPLVPLFVDLVRTAREIARERSALEALRRDFDRLLSCETDDTSARADAVLRAVGQ